MYISFIILVVLNLPPETYGLPKSTSTQSNRPLLSPFPPLPADVFTIVPLPYCSCSKSAPFL